MSAVENPLRQNKGILLKIRYVIRISISCLSSCVLFVKSLDFEDHYRSGSRNIGHQQQPFWRLHTQITQDKHLIFLGSNHLPTIFLKTTLSRTITPDKQLILLGWNHLPTVFLKTTLTQTITLDKQLILLGSNHLPTVFLKTTLTQMITLDKNWYS